MFGAADGVAKPRIADERPQPREFGELGDPSVADRLPDAYQHPEHSLDLIASQTFAEHWQVKAQAENILNAETLITQGKEDAPGDSNTVRRYKEGVDIGIGLSYTH